MPPLEGFPQVATEAAETMAVNTSERLADEKSVLSATRQPFARSAITPPGDDGLFLGEARQNQLGSLVQARKAYFEKIVSNPARLSEPSQYGPSRLAGHHQNASNPIEHVSRTVNHEVKDIGRPLEPAVVSKPASIAGKVATLTAKFNALAGDPAKVKHYASSHEQSAKFELEHRVRPAEPQGDHVFHQPTDLQAGISSRRSSSGYGSDSSLHWEHEAESPAKSLTPTSAHRSDEPLSPVEPLRGMSDHAFNETFGPEPKQSNPVETGGQSHTIDDSGLPVRLNTIDWLWNGSRPDELLRQFTESAGPVHLPKDLEKAAVIASEQLRDTLLKIDRGSDDWRALVVRHLDAADEARLNAFRHVADVLYRSDLDRAALAGNGSEAEANLHDLTKRFNDVVRTHTTIFDNSAHQALRHELPTTLTELIAQNFHDDTAQLTHELGDILTKAYSHFDIQ